MGLEKLKIEEKFKKKALLVSTALNQEAFVGNEIAEKGERNIMEPGQVSLIFWQRL